MSHSDIFDRAGRSALPAARAVTVYSGRGLAEARQVAPAEGGPLDPGTERRPAARATDVVEDLWLMCRFAFGLRIDAR